MIDNELWLSEKLIQYCVLTPSHNSFETITEVLQRHQGCVINDSGDIPFDKWIINTKDFLSFDSQSLKWAALSDPAALLAEEWSNLDTRNRIYQDFGLVLCKTAHNLTQAAQTSGVAQTGKTL